MFTLLNLLMSLNVRAASVERPPQFHGHYRLVEKGSDGACSEGGTFSTGESIDNRPVLQFGERDGVILLDDVDASDDLCRGRLATVVTTSATNTMLEQTTTYYGCKNKGDNGRVMKTIWTITDKTFVAKNVTFHESETITTICKFARQGK